MVQNVRPARSREITQDPGHEVPGLKVALEPAGALLDPPLDVHQTLLMDGGRGAKLDVPLVDVQAHTQIQILGETA